MAPIELEIQSDSEVESIEDSDSDSDGSGDDEDRDFEEREKKKGANKVKDITSGDTQRLRVWKIFVLILMVATTSCVSAGAYYFLKKDENDDYQSSVSLLRGVCRVEPMLVPHFELLPHSSRNSRGLHHARSTVPALYQLDS